MATRDDGSAKVVGAERMLAVLAELARRPDGADLESIARAVDSAKPTAHRALAGLRRAGFAEQDAHGHYLLGDEFLRLAFAHHAARPEHVRVQPVLESIAARFGETAHYAVLDGHEVVYRAKVDPPTGAVRLTSSIGGRNPAHRTGVGKLLLAERLPDLGAVRAWAAEHPLTRRTDRTLTTPEQLHAALAEVRGRGFAVDDGENEPGIVCVAVASAFPAPRGRTGAVSVSAVAYRTPLADLVGRADELRALVDAR